MASSELTPLLNFGTLHFIVCRNLLSIYSAVNQHYKTITSTNLDNISLELEKRLVSIFQRKSDGNRPFQGKHSPIEQDEHWRDLIQFNEYFNGDNGAGIGASHQTGWTAIVTKMINQLNRYTNA